MGRGWELWWSRLSARPPPSLQSRSYGIRPVSYTHLDVYKRQDRDTRGHYAALAVGFGVTNPISVQDEFYEGLQDYNQFAQYLPTVAVLALVLDIAAVLVLVFLCLAAGRHRDREAAVCNGFDRIPPVSYTHLPSDAPTAPGSGSEETASVSSACVPMSSAAPYPVRPKARYTAKGTAYS